MSIKVMSKVWEEATVRGNSLLVLLALADFADDKGEAYPGLAVIARKSRMSERTVQRAIQDLILAKELQVKRNEGIQTATGFTNKYIITRGVNLSPGDKLRGDRLGSQGVTRTVAEGVTRTVTQTVREPSDKPSGTLSLSSEPEKKMRKGSVGNQKPNVKDVIRYCLELGLKQVDGEYLYETFESKNWKGVLNWQATVRKYRLGGWLPSQQQVTCRVSPQGEKPKRRVDSCGVEIPEYGEDDGFNGI